MLRRGNFIYFFPFLAAAALTFASCFSLIVFLVTFFTDSLRSTVEFFEPGIEPFKYNKLFSRSDFIFIGDDPYLLEVNSIPGMTEESIFPKQVKMNGISLKELFTYMIENTLVKFKK